jgi:glycosyltransferase involved in cell wall biosynthesis
MEKKTVSIVCAVHNEELAIPLFYDRLSKVINALNYNFEIIFTNNRSTDSTLDVIQKIIEKDPRVRVLTLSRNFGYQCSLQAGMTYASGDCLIAIDVDCEDPPELIPEFLSRWEDGHDIVYGIRRNRPESKYLTSMRNLFYRILKFTADSNIILNMAEFGLIAQYVRNDILNNSNTFPFLRTEIAYVGYNAFGVEYDRQQRIAGKTHYNFLRMFVFAVAGILTSSTFPFRLAAMIFPVGLLLNIVLFVCDIIYGNGYFFKMLLVMDILYITLLITLNGIYIARIYKNGLNRPLFVVDWKLSTRSLRLASPNLRQNLGATVRTLDQTFTDQ